MKPTDLTIQILSEIRDSVRETNARLDTLTARVTESEIRTATAIMGLSGTLEDVKSLLRERRDLRDRVDRCETEIQTIKQRIGIG